MIKRVLAVIAVAVLLLGLFPMTALAAADAGASPSDTLYGGDSSVVTDAALAEFLSGYQGNSVTSAMDNADLYAESYDVDIVITENRVVKVTETIDIMFNESKHGYQRRIPTSGSEETYRVTNVTATGAEAYIHDEGDNIYVRLGSENKTVRGRKRYVISYDLEYHNDITLGGDRIYQNIIPTKLDNYIQNATARVTFPQSFTLRDYLIHSGEYGSTGSGDFRSLVSGNTIYMYSAESLRPYSGSTIELLFPDGSFPVRPADMTVSDYTARLEVENNGKYTYTQEMTVTVAADTTSTIFPVWQGMSILNHSDGHGINGKKTVVEINGNVVGKDSGDCYCDLAAHRGESVKIKTVQTGAYALSSRAKPVEVLFTPVGANYLDSFIEYKDAKITAQLPGMSDGSGSLVSVVANTGTNSRDYGFDCTMEEGGSSFTATLNGALPIGETAMVMFELKPGALTRATTYTDILSYIFGIVIAMLSAVFIACRDRIRITETMEYYPPEELNPAEVGYIIDNSADPGDLTSLIYYWASQGHLSIEVTGKKTYTLHKGEPLDYKHGEYEQDMYKALWVLGDWNQVKSSQLDEKYYKTLNAARIKLTKEFTKEEKRIVSKKHQKRCTMSRLFGLLALVLMVILCVVTKRLDFAKVMPIAVVSLVTTIMSAGLSRMAFDVKHKSKAKSVLFNVLSVVAGLFGSYMYVCIFRGVSIGIIPAAVLALGACFVPSVLAPQMLNYTEWGANIMGRCSGFKNFLTTAEKSKLEMLLEENPDYYYDILPYAQVLGVSGIWKDKFKGLETEPPSWFYGTGVDRTTAHMLMMNNMNRVSNTMRSAPSSSGGGGGGSFGGGFSGGGGGGGSGGGW